MKYLHPDPLALNGRFDRVVDTLLAKEKATSIAQFIERPKGLERFLANAEIMHHLTRPYAGLLLGPFDHPVFSNREEEFYRACETIGFEIPFRTGRLQTEDEKEREENWKKSHPAGDAMPRVKADLTFARLRNTPRVDQWSAIRLQKTAQSIAAQPGASDAMQVHVIQGAKMEEAIKCSLRAAPARRDKNSATHLYLCVAPHVPNDEHWKGHSLVSVMIFTPESGNRAQRCWVSDPLPVHARRGNASTQIPTQFAQNPTMAKALLTAMMDRENAAVDAAVREMSFGANHYAGDGVLKLPLQEEGYSGDLNCRLYSEEIGKAFIQLAHESPEVLLQKDRALLENALKACMPRYYETHYGVLTMKPRAAIKKENQALRWEMGCDVLQAVAHRKASQLSI